MKSSVRPKITVKLVTRTGRIAPAAWDELDAVTEVMLVWDPNSEKDPGELLLNPDSNTHTLRLFVGREVTVTGRMTHTKDGEPVMCVTRFRLGRSSPRLQLGVE